MMCFGENVEEGERSQNSKENGREEIMVDP